MHLVRDCGDDVNLDLSAQITVDEIKDARKQDESNHIRNACKQHSNKPKNRKIAQSPN